MESAVADYRLTQVERKVEKKADQDDVEKIADEVRGLRKALIGFIVAISGSAILVSFTILQVAVGH